MQGAGGTRKFYLAGGGAPVARERAQWPERRGQIFPETSPALGKRAGAQFG